MTSISLREYNREIENLIESGQIDEAIAHCRYILERFPRHVATYRLLGKAYLESQRYTDAADVLQRVLSCIPDDFISQVGMSIIREDEGNLEAAIWHMERAFEGQPSNAAIQAELRRLYGRRDGTPPAKVHLTRGALARMSAKSHLYSQAISEVRAIIGEDPQRPDLQVLLARLYVLTGQRNAAVETCSTLLQKYPNCLEANRILVEVLPGTERASEAQEYRDRLETLDPYAAHISATSPTAEQVPDNAIQLERLDYAAAPKGDLGAAQPAWAASLGVSLEEQTMGREPTPDWLSGLEAAEAPPQAVQAEPAPAETTPEITSEELLVKEPVTEPIPDWMQAAGWAEASSVPEEIPEPIDFGAAETPGSDELAKAEIPDWLRSIAPQGNEDLAAAETLGAESEPGELDWLSEEAGSVTSIGAATLGAAAAAGLLGQEEEAPAKAVSGDEPESEVEGSPGAEELLPESQPAPSEEALPGWLAPTERPIPPEAEQEVPIWLQELGSAPAESAEVAPAPFVEEISTEGLPESTEIQPDAFEAPPPAVEAAEVGLAGLAGLAVGQIKEEEEETPAISPGVPETMPDWLTEMAAEEGEVSETGIPETIVASEDQSEQLARAELPDWLSQLEENPLAMESEPARETEPALPSDMEVSPTPSEEVPDWLKTAMAAEVASAALAESAEEPILPEAPIIEGDTKPIRISVEDLQPEMPSQLETLAVEAEEAAEIPAPEEAIAEEIQELEADKGAPVELGVAAAAGAVISEVGTREAAPDLADEDATFAWLESLAARQGALEEELLTTPEERPAPPESALEVSTEAEPEGLGVEAGIGAEAGVLGAAAAGLIAGEILESREETPAWLQESEAPVAETPAGEAELELPDWLREFEIEEATQTGEEEESAWVEPLGVAGAPPIQEKRALQVGELLDINAASMSQLERLPGVGFILAQNIIAYREVSGPFTTLEDLEKVPGITPDTAQDLRQWLTLAIVSEGAAPTSELPELSEAWNSLATGNIPAAVEKYYSLIKGEQHLDEVIKELQEALMLYPYDPSLYQALGDAYLRTDQLQEALDAYTRAEDLLK